MGLRRIPLDEGKLLEKLSNYARSRGYTVDPSRKGQELNIKVYNEGPPGLLRVYFTRKGATIDGSGGKNEKLNQELLDYLEEVAQKDPLEETRITLRNVNEGDFHSILEIIKAFKDGEKAFEIQEKKGNKSGIKRHLKVKNLQSREEINLYYYKNKTLYLHGFAWSMGEEIINFIYKVTKRVSTLQVDHLKEVVHHCNEAYITLEEEACKSCETPCDGDCEKLLKRIHYGGRERYGCQKVINYYIPRYGYRYAFEMESLLKKYKENLDEFSKIQVLSIGCGPCTDLLALSNINRFSSKPVKFNGIDLNRNWEIIHGFLKDVFKERYQLDFYYQDIFTFLDKINPDGKGLNSNIVTFQYVFSDMAKYKAKQEINLFLEKFYERVIKHLPSGSLVILNDINHQELSRSIFELLENILPPSGYQVDKYHFHNRLEEGRESYYSYGSNLGEVLVPYPIPEHIQNRYNPWVLCKGAAMVVRKV